MAKSKTKKSLASTTALSNVVTMPITDGYVVIRRALEHGVKAESAVKSDVQAVAYGLALLHKNGQFASVRNEETGKVTWPTAGVMERLFGERLTNETANTPEKGKQKSRYDRMYSIMRRGLSIFIAARDAMIDVIELWDADAGYFRFPVQWDDKGNQKRHPLCKKGETFAYRDDVENGVLLDGSAVILRFKNAETGRSEQKPVPMTVDRFVEINGEERSNGRKSAVAAACAKATKLLSSGEAREMPADVWPELTKLAAVVAKILVDSGKPIAADVKAMLVKAMEQDTDDKKTEAAGAGRVKARAADATGRSAKAANA